MKVYLAGPMRGFPNYNFPAFFAAAKSLRDLGHEVFNPAEKGCESEVSAKGDAANTLEFRRKVFTLDTEFICTQAEVVAMLPHWEQSRGAVAERSLADALGLKVVYLGQEDGWHTTLCDTSRANIKSRPAPPDAPVGKCDKAVAPMPEQQRLLSALASNERKSYPMCTGVLDYFPDALAEVSLVSFNGNIKHNPGQPLHWARGKSMDHPDCVMRHLMERGGCDPEGNRHSAQLVWRALAILQEELEREKGLSCPRGATPLPPR